MRLSPAMQLAMPSSSEMPRRLPLKQTMFGTPAAAALGIMRVASATSLSWFATVLNPRGICPKPFAIAHVMPYFAGVAQSFSSSRSIAL